MRLFARLTTLEVRCGLAAVQNAEPARVVVESERHREVPFASDRLTDGAQFGGALRVNGEQADRVRPRLADEK